MSKAFNTHMSIIDGSANSLMKVSFIKNLIRLPDLNKLSSYYRYSKHQNIVYRSFKQYKLATIF